MGANPTRSRHCKWEAERRSRALVVSAPGMTTRHPPLCQRHGKALSLRDDPRARKPGHQVRPLCLSLPGLVRRAVTPRRNECFPFIPITIAAAARRLVMLRADGISFGYPDRPSVLHEVSLSVPAGSLVGVLGPNGSGKTTLLKLLAGLLTPGSGQVCLLYTSPSPRD